MRHGGKQHESHNGWTKLE